jgi:hypothetical protein
VVSTDGLIGKSEDLAEEAIHPVAEEVVLGGVAMSMLV